jgi:RNA polymerase sigma factor (TIGR02999 family)
MGVRVTQVSCDGDTITVLLKRWREGDGSAAERLVELVYSDLHRMAAREMRRERGPHTLQTTALVHEAFLRLCQAEAISWVDRVHFYAVAAQQLRRILVDHARRVQSSKRGGPLARLPICEWDGAAVDLDERLLAVDEALCRLESLDARAAKVVELRYFGGLSEAEAADALKISVATLKRDWDFARSWLAGQLS